MSCVLGLKLSECSSMESSYIGVAVSDNVVNENIRSGAFDGFLFEFYIGMLLRSTPFFLLLFSPYNCKPSHDSFLDPFLVACVLGFPLTHS